MIWVFLSAIEHWTDIFTNVSKKTRDHCIFLPSGSGQLKAPHFICEAQTNSPNVHLFTGMSVEFHPLFCWPVTQSCKLFYILSLSINSFIPLTKSCLTTRFSHCSLLPWPLMSMLNSKPQLRTPLVNFPHCKNGPFISTLCILLF